MATKSRSKSIHGGASRGFYPHSQADVTTMGSDGKYRLQMVTMLILRHYIFLARLLWSWRLRERSLKSDLARDAFQISVDVLHLYFLHFFKGTGKEF
jgi:hypothetical protein